MGHMTEYPRIFPNFQNCKKKKKDLKDNKDNSLHLGRKYARMFVLGHYLFLVAHSFPRVLLSENCLLHGTDNVCRQISEHILAPNGDYRLFTRRNVTQRTSVIYSVHAVKQPISLPLYIPQLVKSLPFHIPEA